MRLELCCYDIQGKPRQHPTAEPNLTVLPELADAAVNKRRAVDPGSDADSVEQHRLFDQIEAGRYPRVFVLKSRNQ